ncbi:MAG TPA: D-2-hydroxyacid dehydrogenase [Streptosporangiaceae bacterium]|jgi:phosphoglycerate dehydrogenase-like enzyme
MTPGAVRVLIATPLEAELAAAIAAAEPRATVLYAPDLLPVPRYPADHSGTARQLSAEQQQRWTALRASADVSFDFDWQQPGEVQRTSPRLRWVQATSAGIGGFLERTGLARAPIVFTTAAGVHGTPLAEFTLAALLHFIKDIPGLTSRQTARQWQRHATGQLAGRRALLVGLGGIGRQVAQLLSAAGVEVCGAGRAGRSYDIPGVRRYTGDTQLAAALPDADALVLACPLTERTRGLIGAAELALLPAGALLVNIARGPVVDEQALIAALRSGHLGGAALDVFETEPLPAASPLWQMPNVLISPHSAATVAAENERLTDLFIDNLRRWLAGSELRNVYDRDAGY